MLPAAEFLLKSAVQGLKIRAVCGIIDLYKYYCITTPRRAVLL